VAAEGSQAALARPAALLLLGVTLAFFSLGLLVQIIDLPTGLALTQVTIFLVPALLFARTASPRPATFLLLDGRVGVGALLLVLLAAAANYLVAAAGMGLCTRLLPESWQVADASRVLATETGTRLGVIVFTVVALAPFCEEVLFRGAVEQGLIGRLGPGRAILFTALAFSALHADPIGFLPRLELGLVFGFLAYRTQALLSAVLAHTVNNATAAALFYLGGGAAEPERSAPLLTLVALLLVGLALLVPALVGLHRLLPPPSQLQRARRSASDA
jgi:membrane protease YdiL (CAAX protease family)